MTQPTPTTLQCSNCGTPNQVTLRRVIDAKQDPQGKAMLLSGQINQFQCQSCGMVNTVSAPLLYHDPDKELLIAFVPMDVSMKAGNLQQSGNEEKMIGDLMNDLTRTIPQKDFRAYMFSPKRALTMKGLIEQVLEAEGVTPEMMAEQEARMALLQEFIQAETEEDLVELVKANDDKIDMTTFQTLSLMAQRLSQTGQQQAVGHLAAIQQILLENSTFGQELSQREANQQQTIEAVANDLQALGQDADYDDFVKLVMQYQGDEDRLQALVGLIRPVMDEEFFTRMGTAISKAPAAEREGLEATRDALRQYIAAIDEQTRMLVQQKAQFLQALLNTADHEQVMRENLPALDDDFMTILSTNIQEAERRGDVQISAKLKQIYETAVELLQAQMTPELRFINDLLTAPDDATMQALIKERGGQFGEELMEMLTAVEQMLAAQGQQAALQRLGTIRAALSDVQS